MRENFPMWPAPLVVLVAVVALLLVWLCAMRGSTSASAPDCDDGAKGIA